MSEICLKVITNFTCSRFFLYFVYIFALKSLLKRSNALIKVKKLPKICIIFTKGSGKITIVLYNKPENSLEHLIISVDFSLWLVGLSKMPLLGDLDFLCVSFFVRHTQHTNASQMVLTSPWTILASKPQTHKRLFYFY